MNDPTLPRTAILIVNGGSDPREGRWLSLTVSAIRKHTPDGAARLYVWNNNVEDPEVPSIVSAHPDSVLVQAEKGSRLDHIHADPLKRLCERAASDGFEVVVTMDNDAFPVRSGWLEDLLRGLDSGAVLAGVWRDDNREQIRPYLHPCCLAVRVATVRDLGLDFLEHDWESGDQQDTLSSFTVRAGKRHLPFHRWRRSNCNEIDPLLGGIYGDFVYHHGASTERDAARWGQGRNESWEREVRDSREESAALLFRYQVEYFQWLRGSGHLLRAGKGPGLVLLLGMQRSGLRCLSRCLAFGGLAIHRSRARNQAEIRLKSGLERLEDINSRVASHGATAGLAREAGEVLGDLGPFGPVAITSTPLSGIVDFWRTACPRLAVVGTFRHASAASRVLLRIGESPGRRAMERWRELHTVLLREHERSAFPLVEFGSESPEAYSSWIGHVAIALGLDPDPPAILRVAACEWEMAGTETDADPPGCKEILYALRARRGLPAGWSEGFPAELLRFKERRARWRLQVPAKEGCWGRLFARTDHVQAANRAGGVMKAGPGGA